jgi:ubiquinone/menaquinone biosynthesis C-methylase UbiE
MGKLANEKHENTLIQKFLPALEDGKLAKTLRSGGSFMDLGCGEGAAACCIAKAFPAARVVGVDVNVTSLDAARVRAHAEGLTNVSFVLADITAPGGGEAVSVPGGGFDIITAFDVIHDLPNPTAALVAVNSLLTPGTGRFAMVDIRAGTGLQANLSHSMAPFLYTVSLLHCMPQGLQGGGAGLGMMWGRDKALELLRKTGFSSIDVLELDFDSFNDCFLCHPGP